MENRMTDVDRLREAVAEADRDMLGCAEKGGDFIDGADWALGRVRTALEAFHTAPEESETPEQSRDIDWIVAEHRAALEAAPVADEARERLVLAALRYYADTMPGYAAAAGLTQDEYAAVMVDVRRAREYGRTA